MCLLYTDYASGPVPAAAVVAAAAQPGKSAGSPACGPSGLCATWKPLRKPCLFPPSFFFFRTRCGYISYLLLSFLMWSHLVGFWLALCVLVSISSLSWIQCLVSVYCILCISYSLLLRLVTVMLSQYELYFIIISLSHSATLASAFWKIHCFFPSLFKVMLLHFSAPSREKCWTSWQF